MAPRLSPRPQSRMLSWMLLGCLSVSGIGICGDVATASSPRVPGYERFFADPAADLAAGGHLLISELNCRSCHAGDRTGSGPVTDKIAPVLDLVGDRVRPEWIRQYLTAPQSAKPGTTMPDVLQGLAAEERAAAVEALTHFLASTGTVQDSHADAAGARRGRELFQQVGCAACHDGLAPGSQPLATSASLPKLDDKYTLHSLATFLKDPLKVRPSGRMPAIGLKDEEYRDLAQHFLQGRKMSPNVRYEVFQGSWSTLPDFDSLKPQKTGTCAGLDLTVAGAKNNFAIRFRSHFYLKEAGKYAFTLGSDDGSRLLVDGRVFIDNDGVHPHSDKKVGEPLEAGWHEFEVQYFQGGGEWTLSADIEIKGLPRQPLSALASLTTDRPLAEQSTSSFVVDADLAQRGRELFARVGCANCHSLTYNEQKIVASKTAKRWDSLSGAGGCLSESPPANVANYQLTARQVQSIAAALGKAPVSAPAEDVHRTLVTLNCYACHLRNEIGGVETERNAWFGSSQQEMGDEGRIPPTLTGVGDKLREDWLKHVLDRGANDRQLYMQTKMPRFGNRNVGHLIPALATLDRQPESLPKVEFSEPDYRVLADGRHLVGGKALSCIKCHDFAKLPSQGVRAINLTTMTLRLREDWFYRYMTNPQDFRPGTRMPAPWPFGQATVRDVLNANPEQQMVAVWKYLSLGDKAPVPFGLVREPIELVADATPVLYRNFIEGAGSRAIGVGYPEKLNLAWDANDMRLSQIWHGAFIDASRHWNGRGVGYEPPLGDHVWSLPAGPPLATLASSNEAWPTALARENGFQFRGYALNSSGQPEFRFRWSDLEIRDFCQPLRVDGQRDPQLHRELTITGSPTAGSPMKDAYFRAITAGKLAPTDVAGEWLVDDIFKVRVQSTEAPVLRTLAGRQELLIPLAAGQKSQQILIDYAW